MTDPWDERTEAIPGVKKDGSIELDIDTPVAQPASTGPSAMSFLDAPRVVVFEPSPLGVAEALAPLGFQVKALATAVDVMEAIARNPPALVVCAPCPEPERRRMLVAALRLRFPSIAVVYVSRHARQEEAVLGAIREGARAVVAWPLPPPAELRRVLALHLGAAPPPAEPRAPDEEVDTAPLPRAQLKGDAGDAPTAPHRRPEVSPGSDPDAGFDELATAVLPPLKPEPQAGLAPRTVQTKSPHSVVEDLPSDALMPLPVPVPVPLPPAGASLLGQAPVHAMAEDPEPATAPERRTRGELGELFDTLSPFWWSLDDAAAYLRARAERGDRDAHTHARTIQAVLRALEQIRARIDETGA